MEVLALVSCTPFDVRLHPLVGAQSLAALHIGGNARLIDYYLSAIRVAGIRESGILLRGFCRDLVNHIFAASQNRDSLFFLPQQPHLHAAFSISALQTHRDLLERRAFDHVLLAACSAVFVPDFLRLLNEHVQSGADATLLVAPEVSRAEYGTAVRTSDAGLVTAITRGVFCQADRYLGCAMLRRELFWSLLGGCILEHAALLDALSARLEQLRVRTLPHRGFYAFPTTPGAYLHANLELSPHGADVTRFPDARIGSGSVLDHCLVLPGAEIGANCRLSYVICGEGARLQSGTEIRGQPQYPFLLCRT